MGIEFIFAHSNIMNLMKLLNFPRHICLEFLRICILIPVYNQIAINLESSEFFCFILLYLSNETIHFFLHGSFLNHDHVCGYHRFHFLSFEETFKLLTRIEFFHVIMLS